MELGLKVAPRQKGQKKGKAENDGRRQDWLKRSRFVKFLPFLLLAFLIWVQQTLQYDMIRPIYFVVGQDSLSVSHGVGSKIPELLEVQVKDKGWEHIRYSLREQDTLQLRYIEDKNGSRYVGIQRKELGEEIASRLSNSATVVQMSFNELRIPVYKRVSKKLPVEIEGKIRSANGYTVARIGIKPDSLLVYGTEAKLSKLKSIHTEYWGDSTIMHSTQRTLKLNLPDGLFCQSQEVKVQIELEELTEQSYVLPIEIINVPEGYKITPLPSTATVLLTIPRSRFKDIDDNQLQLIADYNSNTNEGELQVQLRKYPRWVVQVRLSNNFVQFVKERINPW